LKFKSLIHDLYCFISIFVTAGVLLAGGLALLFSSTPKKPLLGNYRKARNMMAVAYLVFMVVHTIKNFICDFNNVDVHLLQTITLVIAVSQALLFTLAFLALIDTKFPGWHYIFKKLIPASIIIIAIFAVYAFCSGTCFIVAFFSLTVLYALLLARYSHLFLVTYRRFMLQLDNYYSDNEAARMRWMFFTFIAALSLGIMALLTTIFMSIPVLLIFTFVYNVFYVWFAIRFIRYAYRFHIIEKVFDEEDEKVTETDLRLRSETDLDQQVVQSTIFLILEKKVEKWVAEKQFTEKGVTIAILSNKLQTNRYYLSSFINTCKGKTFREWINELRIEEAKIILRQFPNKTVNDIALQMGFTDKSHFIRQFSKLTGVSPKEWKMT